MNTLHPIFQQALKPFAPPEPTEAKRVAADLSYLAGKKIWHQRNDAAAMALQLATQDKGGAA